MKQLSTASILGLLLCNEVLSLIIVGIWGWIGTVALFRAMATNNFH